MDLYERIKDDFRVSIVFTGHKSIHDPHTGTRPAPAVSAPTELFRNFSAPDQQPARDFLVLFDARVKELETEYVAIFKLPR